MRVGRLTLPTCSLERMERYAALLADTLHL